MMLTEKKLDVLHCHKYHNFKLCLIDFLFYQHLATMLAQVVHVPHHRHVSSAMLDTSVVIRIVSIH